MDNQLIQAVSSHIERFIGKPANVLHELIPDDVHVDIHIVEPTEKRPFYTLVTSGMSEQPMDLPEEMLEELTPHVELMLCLPRDWQINKRDDKRWNWPMKWLWFLAKYPFKFNTWIYVSHTIPNTEECEPFGPGTLQCCWFVRGPLTVSEDFQTMKYRERTVAFLALTAIYRGEMEFALSKEMDSLYALDQALEKSGITELVQPARPQLPPDVLKRYLGKLPS